MKARILALALMAATAAAHADVTVFSDDFNANTGGLNLVPTGWNVSAGAVDIIGTGTAWDFFPANGKFIDLDGSSNAAGVLSMSLSGLSVGTTYTLSFDLAGSQRPGYDNGNVVDVQFGSSSNNYLRDTYAGFSTESLSFVATSTSASFSFHNQGGDYVGALLDNVKVTTAVPEPETYALMLAGLVAVGFISRRRAAAQA